MKRLVRSFHKDKKGFTLIELLVVIAIVGVIAAIVVPNLGVFFGGGQAEQEQRYLDAARAVAEDIPLPTWYCPVHGIACEPEDIEAELIGYSTSTGEPVFNITCKAMCPEVGFFTMGASEERHKFYLVSYYDGFLVYWDPSEAKDISLSELTDDEVKKCWR